MPQESGNTPSDLIQAPESPWLSGNSENLGSNEGPKSSPAVGEATTIDQGNSHAEFDSSQSQNLAFLDGTDVIPKIPPILFPEIPDIIQKNVPEFIDGVRQWLRNPEQPKCSYGYHEFCCQLAAPDPKLGPKGRDIVEMSKRRKKCSLCTRKNPNFSDLPLSSPKTMAPHAALIWVPYSGSRDRLECYFPENIFCCFCMDGVRTIRIGSEFLPNNSNAGAD